MRLRSQEKYPQTRKERPGRSRQSAEQGTQEWAGRSLCQARTCPRSPSVFHGIQVALLLGMGDWNPSSMREAIRGKGRKEQRNVLVRPEARGRGLGRGFRALPTTAHLLVGQEHQAPRTAGLCPWGTLQPQLLQPTWVEGEGAQFSTSWASRVFLHPYSSPDLPGGGDPQKPVPQLSQRHCRENAQGASRN